MTTQGQGTLGGERVTCRADYRRPGAGSPDLGREIQTGRNGGMRSGGFAGLRLSYAGRFSSAATRVATRLSIVLNRRVEPPKGKTTLFEDRRATADGMSS